MELIIIYPVFIGIALATSQLAYQKGYRVRWWFLFALILPIISTFILFFLKRKPKSTIGFHAPVDRNVKDKVLFKKDNY